MRIVIFSPQSSEACPVARPALNAYLEAKIEAPIATQSPKLKTED